MNDPMRFFIGVSIALLIYGLILWINLLSKKKKKKKKNEI